MLGAGPAGLTAAHLLGVAWHPGGRVRGRHAGGRDREDGRARRLPLRPRRPPLLHEGAVGAGDVGADARRRVPPPAAAVPHLLPRRVLRVPVARARTSSGVSASSRRSAAWARTRPHKMRRAEPPQTFEDWVTGRFGRRLYDAFFREYTEKVWGIPGSEIQAEWAAQRIRNLSFWTALTSALRLKRAHVTSLIEEFHYPRLGPGPDVGAVRGELAERRRARAARPPRDADRPRRAGVARDRGRRPERHSEVVAVEGVVSSIPLSELVLSLDPLPPDDVVDGRGAPALPRPARRRARSRPTRSRSRTTGSTFTTPAPAPGACRTSAPGAPG